MQKRTLIRGLAALVIAMGAGGLLRPAEVAASASDGCTCGEIRDYHNGGVCTTTFCGGQSSTACDECPSCNDRMVDKKVCWN